jgi:PKD repeat protein
MVQIQNNNAYVDTWSWDFGDAGTANLQNPYHTYTDTGTYTVSLTVNWETCEETIQRDFVVVEDTTNSIKQINKEQGFILYPNPTKSLLFVELKDESKKLKAETVQILDINSKLVKTTVIASEAWQSVQTIQISDLQKGTYFVKIGEETQRFIKE